MTKEPKSLREIIQDCDFAIGEVYVKHFKDKNIEFAVWCQVLKLEEQGPSDNVERSLEAVRQVNNLNRRDAKKVLSLAEKLFEQSV